jgi:PAS domain S-box-containing protein
MDESRKTKSQLLVELQEMRRRLQEAEAALRDYRKDQPAGEGAIRGEAAGGQPAEEESGFHGSEDQSQHLLAQLAARTEELQAVNQELAIQAEELRSQNEALQALNVRLAVQKEELERITVELEAERALLKTVLEQMPGGIIIAAAPSGKFLLVNRQMAKIFGHPVSQEDSLETYSHDRAFRPDGSSFKPGEFPLARAISVGQVVIEEEISFIREDGAFRTIQVSAAPVRDRLGRIIAGVGTYHDITEKRAAEKALVDSEARYRRLVDLAPDAILVHQEGKYVFANQAGIRLFGASSLDELVGKSVLELVHPDYREISSERIKMAQSGRVTELRESKVLRLDGQPVDVEVTGVGINYRGQPAIQIMMRDITGRKRAEAERERLLAERDRTASQLEAVLNTMSEGLIISDLEGNILAMNRAAMGLRGFESLDQVRRHMSGFKEILELRDLSGKLVPVEEWPMARALRGETFSGMELRLRRRDTGQEFICSYSGAPVLDQDGRPILAIVNVGDITAHKRSEAALRESQQDLNRAQAVAHTGSWRLDTRRNELLWSDETYRIFGISPGSPLTYERFLAAVHPEDREYVDRKWRAAMEGEPYDIEHRIVMGDTVKWVRERAELEFDSQGHLWGGFGTVQDITGRKRADEAVVRAKEEWERTFNAVPDLIAIIDKSHRIVRVNRAMAAVLGMEPEDLVGRSCPQIMHGSSKPPRFCPHSRLLDDGQEHTAEVHELGRDFLVSATPLTDSQGNLMGSVHVARDITARKQAEMALHRSNQRLDLLAETAGQLLASALPQQVVDDLCHKVMKFLDCEAFFNFLADEEAGRLRLNAYAGIPAAEAKKIEWLDYGVAVCGSAAREGCRIVTENIQTTPDPRTELVKSYGIQAYACHPLIMQGRVLGTLSFGTRKRSQFSADDLALMKTVADQVAIAMDRKLAQEALQRAHDELELRVKERTTELRDTVAQLIEEVHDRQLAQESLRKQAELLELAQEAIIVRDLDSRVTFWNRGAAEKYGWTREQALGQVTHDLFKTRFPTSREEVDRELLQMGQWQGELVHTRADGEEIVVASRQALQRDDQGNPAAFLEINRDVTARHRAEEALKTERQRLLAVLEGIPAYVVLLAPDCTIPYANREFKRRFGDPGSRRCYEFLFGLEAPCEGCKALEVFKTNTPAIWEWAGPDGNVYQICDYPFIDVDGTPLVLEMGLDITARKRAEEQVVSIGRMYRMLSKVNEAIVRVTDRDELFRQICRIAVEEGLFRMAWIGMVDQEQGVVKSVAQYGLDEGYLEKIRIPLRKGPESRGPTGTAAREGRYDVCNHIADDPRMAPWRQRALERGYHSSGAFPLRIGSQVVGTITMYAGEPGFFIAEEIGLLESMAQDVSFALESMETETQRRQAEEALRESEQKLRYLATQLIDSQEAERRRVSLELHDDLGQSLMVLTMKLRAIAKIVPPVQGKIKGYCDEALDYVNEIVENVRRLARDLRPSVLEDLGLPAALRHLAKTYDTYHGIEVVLDMDDIAGLFGPKEEINIYRIFQESLTNIAKYAQASRVSFIIKKAKGRVAFRVEDNGRGFNVDQILARDADRSGLGLAAIEERVRMLRGSLEISSQEGRGTSIAFVAPVQEVYKPLH